MRRVGIIESTEGMKGEPTVRTKVWDQCFRRRTRSMSKLRMWTTSLRLETRRARAVSIQAVLGSRRMPEGLGMPEAKAVSMLGARWAYLTTANKKVLINNLEVAPKEGGRGIQRTQARQTRALSLQTVQGIWL